MSDMITLLSRVCILLLLIALLSTASLGAAALERLLLSTGNDAISLGLGNNQDDGKSFSVRTEALLHPGWHVAIELTSHTDQRKSKHRYDTMDTAVAYPFHLTLSPSWSLTLTPDLAFMLIGPFGLEQMQTLLHSFKQKKPVILPISTDALAVHPGGGLDLELSYRRRLSRYSIIFATDHRHRWESEIEGAVGFHYGDALTATVGYHFTKGWSGFPTQYMQEDRYNGLFITADYDANLLFTSYRYYPKSGFSFGYIGFDVLAFGKPRTYRKSDLTITHGLFYEVDGNPLRLTALAMGPAVISLRYMSGPIDGTHRFNIGEYSLSYRWHLFKQHRYLHPSFQVGAGVKRFNLVEYFDETVLEAACPIITAAFGVGLGANPLWIVANTAYSVEVGASLTYVFATDRLATSVARFDHHTKAWVLLLGITLVIDHDLS